MNAEGFLEWLSAQNGVERAEPAPKELLDTIADEESTVVSAFGTPLDNSGMRDVLDRGTAAVVFTGEEFRVPQKVYMILKDRSGATIGHNVPADMMPGFLGRDDVLFISNDFLMYAGCDLGSHPVMELRSMPYPGDNGAPEGLEPVIWFPSPTSSSLIHRWFGVPETGMATALIAVDL